MERKDYRGAIAARYNEIVHRLFAKCRGLDDKMRKEGKSPIVTDTMKGFIPSNIVDSANVERAMEYILDLENEIDSLIRHFEADENAGRGMQT